MVVDKTPVPKVPKGDPNKQYDVVIAVVHDDRKGKTGAVVPARRFSFATAEEAIAFANNLNTEEK